jgi:hypothetical protein
MMGNYMKISTAVFACIRCKVRIFNVKGDIVTIGRRNVNETT